MVRFSPDKTKLSQCFGVISDKEAIFELPRKYFSHGRVNSLRSRSFQHSTHLGARLCYWLQGMAPSRNCSKLARMFCEGCSRDPLL